MISIAMFNNKGGVGKTTLLCNLAGYLQTELKKNVLVIDADPQCNCTSYTLDEDTFYNVYYEPKCFTISDIVPPLQKGKGFVSTISTVKSNGFGFDVLPGNPKLAICEDFLSSDWNDVAAAKIRGIRTNMLFDHLLSLCCNYDYVFFDMGPSLGAINRSILLACDFFITPMSADIFSLLALENIGSSINKWRQEFNTALKRVDPDDLDEFKCFNPECSVKFLGYVEQQYITKTDNGTKRAVHAYESILSQIPEVISKNVVIPINGKNQYTLEYKIGSIPNYYSLVPMSQSAHKPLFSLTGSDGVVGAHYKKVNEFKSLMDTIAARFLTNMEVMS